MKKILLIALFVVIVFVVYRVAYNLGKNNKFFCEVTGGDWLEEEQVVGDQDEIHFTLDRGCHIKSDLIGEIR